MPASAIARKVRAMAARCSTGGAASRTLSTDSAMAKSRMAVGRLRSTKTQSTAQAIYTRSVLGRPAGAMHDQDVHLPNARVEFQAELLAYRRKDRRCIGRFGSSVGRRERRAATVQARAGS